MYVLLAVIDLPTVLHWLYTSTRWEKVLHFSRSAFSSVDLLSWLQFDQQYNEFKLRSIMSEHKRTITAISWCPGNPDLFASASADNLLIIWNVAEQRTVARLDNTKGQQRICHWSHRAPEGLTFTTVLCFPRCPHISQLVLELSWWGGICVPAWPAIHLGLRWSWPRGHRPQGGPLVPLRHLPLQVAPQQKRQAGVWTHGWQFVHFSTRCVCFLSSWALKTFSSFR